jgi:sulfur-carrier protein
MATVWIPSLLRECTRGKEQVQVSGNTLREVIDALDELFPGIKQRICEGDRLRPGITVAVDGIVVSVGLLKPVEPNSEIHFLPAVSGG